MGVVEQYLLQLNTEKRRWRRAVTVLTLLSLIVALVTVWNLRMTGVTIANSASCGIEEHQHDAECMKGDELICGKQEHTHSFDCYSDPEADLETPLEWQTMFADYPYTGDLRKDLVGVAKTQVGYTESQLNFEAGNNGVRRGYTRYGAWYGAPYKDWSAMFVSYCLHFAGADAKQFPNSSGGVMMAELWKKQERFAAAGQYQPQSGDIVFFRNNTVGIVGEVYNATFYVIRGDMQNAVRAGVMALGDASITGWGITGDPNAAPQLPPQAPATEKDVLDISNGPSVQIYEGEMPELVAGPLRSYSLRSRSTVVDLLPYLEASGGGYFFTLLDRNNMELPKDANGNYIAQANTAYKLTLSFTSPQGFSPGTYEYQIPNGLMVDGGEGSFVLKDGTEVGSWVVTDTGLITLVFNDKMNTHTDITISATLGINFPEQNDPIDFDGRITVTVEKPPPQQFPTQLYKWGQQGDAASGQDPRKIYWTVQILGNQDSQIPGNILSDQVLHGQWSKEHRYTASDIAGGLTFGVSEPDPVTGEFKDWHTWHISPDDPHLIWTEEGWYYKMPQTATCEWCGEVVLGNANWIYTVNYTSTPDPINTTGAYGYENEASIDGKYAYGWTDFTHGEATGEMHKVGSFVSDAGGSYFLWEFQAVIPGIREGEKADYHWYIMDYMYLLNKEAYHAGYAENDAHLALVTAQYNGTTINVPRIQDATANDLFAWDNAWTANNNGINYGREINLLCRCQCNADNCQFWNGKCENYWFQRDDGVWATNGFCQCWAVDTNVTFTFVYLTEALPVIDAYGGLGYSLQNVAELYFKPTGTSSGALVADANASVPIPGVFNKALTQDFNGYTAHYQITVNEAKAVLTNGTPLTIHDVMSNTLAYISGSLVIKTENANGHTSVLQQGIDYTVSYDGRDGLTDDAGNKVHILDIVIQNPQPVMYILDYDTTLIMPDQFTGGIKYSNSASITLWGNDLTDPGVEKVYADINIAAKSYTVNMYKTCALTNKPLGGATFGLYNAQGGLITTGVTDDNGRLSFQTNIVQGIVLREHVLYYLQELRPPPAYRLDNTKHWFCFCGDTVDYCEECNHVLSDTQGARIPFEEVGVVDIVNYPADVDLPATGGVGYSAYILCGLIPIAGSLVYGFGLRRKRERRLRN